MKQCHVYRETVFRPWLTVMHVEPGRKKGAAEVLQRVWRDKKKDKEKEERQNTGEAKKGMFAPDTSQ